MCLIVDTNLVTKVFVEFEERDFAPIRTALARRRATAVWGGRLKREYFALARYRRLFAEYERSGSLRMIPDSEVDEEETRVVQDGACRSDDQHIVALARCSGVRLLCSRDQDLHADFTNPGLLSPPGSVYQRRSHRKLLSRHCR